jgi:DNA-binding IclR family transcriptional regulator
MVDLCAATGLNRPTAHRILRSLVQAGLLKQRVGSPRYFLGPGLFELGQAAPNPIASFPEVRGLVEQLSATTGDTAYLMLRSHEEVVCMWRAEGAYPIKANVLALGDRRPLGASVAGLSLLAALPAADASALILQNTPGLARHCRMEAADVERHVRVGRAAGYVVGCNAVMEGVTAVGHAVPAPYGHPYLALSISAVNARIPEQRIASLVALLGKVTQKIANLYI